MGRAHTPSDDDAPGLVFRARHARFIHPDVPYHVFWHVFQGRHLLRPCAELRAVVTSVIGRAQSRYSGVRLYAAAFLSNHAHVMLQGPPEQVPAFIGFIKREISKRWGGHPSVKWRGSMWCEYKCTALPTAASQVECLSYVLGQGVKEGLVARPQDWPGFHCANALLLGEDLKGRWFEGTRFSRACDAQKRRVRPAKVSKADYFLDCSVHFSPIPPWKDLSLDAYRRAVGELVAEIEARGRITRAGRPPLGAQKLQRVPLEQQSKPPSVPWLEARSRMICWASPHAWETRRYLGEYWAFQGSFHDATTRDRKARHGDFPTGSHAPGRCILAKNDSSSAA